MKKLALGIALALSSNAALADKPGTCRDHKYKVYDGTHDGDDNGVGCQSKPDRPSDILAHPDLAYSYYPVGDSHE